MMSWSRERRTAASAVVAGAGLFLGLEPALVHAEAIEFALGHLVGDLNKRALDRDA